MNPLKAEPIDIDISTLGTAEDIKVVKSKSLLNPEALTQFLMRLNKELNLEYIFKEIARTIMGVVPIDHMEYKNSQLPFQINIGKSEVHVFQYRLVDDSEHDLGTITLSRQSTFLETDIEKIETILAYAMLAIRNNIEHQNVLKTSLVDSLTETGNRRALANTLQQVFELSKRHEQIFSIIAIDIDKFKHINDTYGHDTGDKLLQKMSQVFKECIREYDQVFRIGGEEFIIVLNQAHQNYALTIANRLKEKIASEKFIIHGFTIHATISIGVSTYQKDDQIDLLLKRADQALYKAKAEGRNCVRT